jgi:hypothetical protein
VKTVVFNLHIMTNVKKIIRIFVFKVCHVKNILFIACNIELEIA